MSKECCKLKSLLLYFLPGPRSTKFSRMKKLFGLIAFIGCSLFFSSSVTAQQQIRNYTDCKFEVKVAVGQDDCQDVTIQTYFVGANDAVVITLGNGESIQYASGSYLNTTCNFHIGLDCSVYPVSTSVDCNTACGDYDAKLFSWGIRLED